MDNVSVLIIDDERQIRNLLEITLESNGYRTMAATDAESGLLLASRDKPQLILLDLGLPDIDGQEVLTTLRKWYHNPIIILTVKNAESEIVRALDNGANDYLTKPFRTQELLARIRKALRHHITVAEPLITFAGITIDLAGHVVKSGDTIIKLTATEYALLALLAKNEGRVLTHHYLLREVWGNTYVEQTQYLRVFVAQLRKKIEADPNRPQHILTESGIGYRFTSG